MEAVLGGMRGRVPGLSPLVLVPVAVLSAICLIAIAVYGVRVIAASGAFDVEQVQVTGAGSAAPSVRDAAYAEVAGRSLLDVDPQAVAAALAALPRVQRVTVDRAFPHALAISVVLERAVAVAPSGDGRVVLAASGRVLGRVRAGAMSLPVIAAAPADIPAVGGTVTAPGVRQQLALAAIPHRGIRFAAIGYSQDGLTGRTPAGLSVRFGDSSDVGVKLRVARSVLRRAAGGVQYIDVSVPGAPALRQDTADPLTADAPPPTAPAVTAASIDGAGGWSGGASPAESIRTLFG